MTNTPKTRDGAQFLMNVPAGTQIKEFRGRMIVCSPNEPPYYLTVEIGPDGLKPIKEPLIAG